MFSIALATVILPGLAAHHAEQSPERFASTLDWAIKLTTIIVLPATVALLRAGRPADGHDLPLRRVRRAGRAHVHARADGVFLRADGLQHGQGAGARLFRAAGHASTPVRIGVQSLGVNMGLNVLIVLPLALWHQAPGCMRCWR